MKPRTSNTEGGAEAGDHEGPEANTEPLAPRVEGKVAVGTLGVVVRRGHARVGGVEATAGDRGGLATGDGGDHLVVN